MQNLVFENPVCVKEMTNMRYVIIGHRWSKSTCGAENYNKRSEVVQKKSAGPGAVLLLSTLVPALQALHPHAQGILSGRTSR